MDKQINPTWDRNEDGDVPFCGRNKCPLYDDSNVSPACTFTGQRVLNGYVCFHAVRRMAAALRPFATIHTQGLDVDSLPPNGIVIVDLPDGDFVVIAEGDFRAAAAALPKVTE